MSDRGPRKSPRQSPRPTRSRAAAEVAWSAPVQVADIPETGRRVELSADAATREAVAKATGVVALPRLEAAFDLAPTTQDGVRVAGVVSAAVEQNCVVTLDPMTSQVEERIDLVFVPPRAAAPLRDIAVRAGSDEDDQPEILQNGVIDLGTLATEFLMLGIDPYPRSPGANFETPDADDDTMARPFAALAVLKKDSGAKQR